MRWIPLIALVACTTPEEDAYLRITSESCVLALRCTTWYADEAACLAAADPLPDCEADPVAVEACVNGLAASTCEPDGSLPPAPAECADVWHCEGAS